MATLIVITRPGQTGAQLQQALGEEHMASLHLPGMVITGLPLPEQLPDAIRSADWWIFTSPAAIHYAAHWLIKFALPSDERQAIAVLSQKSALKLRELLALSERTRIIWPENGHRSEDLLRHPKLQQLDNQRIIIFNAPGGRRLLADTLSERGAKVKSLPVYQRQPAVLESNSLQQLDNWSGSTLTLWTSNTAIDNLRQQLPPALWQKLISGDHLSLSVRQKNALEKVCTGKIYLAHAPDNASLQQQLVQLGTQG